MMISIRSFMVSYGKVNSWDKAQFWNIDKDYDNTKETWHAF